MLRMITVLLCLTASAASASGREDTLCYKMVIEAVDAGYLKPDTVNSQGMRMIVDVGFWEKSDLGTRRGMINAIECAVAGEGNYIKRLDLISSSTGRVVARKQMGEINIFE